MKKIAALALLLAVAPAAMATVVLSDDFESYADTAALNVAWPKGVGTDADTLLDVDPLDALNQVVRNTNVAARRDLNITPTVATAGNLLVWSFDFYDFAGNTTGPRQYGQLHSRPVGGGSLNELIAMGQYNAAAPVHNNNKYQARVAFGPSAVNWFNLNTDRSVGWHEFKAIIGPTTVDFYVDGVADTLGIPHAGAEWYHTRIGSGLSATANALYDNWGLETIVPEPATLALLAMGGLVIVRRRR